jgi:hypothetical protein
MSYVLKTCKISYSAEQKAVCPDIKYLWDLCALELKIFKKFLFSLNQVGNALRYLLMAMIHLSNMYLIWQGLQNQVMELEVA